MNAELAALSPNPAQVVFDMDKRLINKLFSSPFWQVTASSAGSAHDADSSRLVP